MDFNLDIDLRQIRYECPIFDLIKKHKAKRIVCATWTLSESVFNKLESYAEKGNHVTVYYAQAAEDFIPFEANLVHRPNQHAKIWQLDKAVYVGSCNLVDDTIANIMVKLSCFKAKAAIDYLNSLRSTRHQRNNILL